MNNPKPFTLALLADTHYYSPALGTQGEAYRLRSGADQKCLAESGDVLREAFRQICRSGADAVVIAGDLTNNGERCSHEELRALLRETAQAVPIYVLTATHDWCSDQKCARFVDDQVYYDVPTMAEDQLADFYREFGTDKAIDVYTSSWGDVSCTVTLRDDLRLLLLNDDRNGAGRAGYTEGHLRWIEAQLQKAAADGARVIAAAHHPVLPPIHPFLTEGSSIGNWKRISERLADAGLRCVVTGHMHMQQLLQASSPAGNSITAISLGALCGWPGNIVYADVFPQEIRLRTEPIEAYSELLRRQSLGVLTNILNGALQGRDAFRQRTDALYLRGDALLFPFVRKWAKRFDDWTLSQAYAAVRKNMPLLPRLTLREIGQRPLGQTVESVFLSIFGDGLALSETDELYKLVMAFFALPARVMPFATFARKLRESGDRLLRKQSIDGAVIPFASER